MPDTPHDDSASVKCVPDTMQQLEKNDTLAQRMAAEISLISEPENPLPEAKLELLPQKLRDAIARAGWQELLPVQAKSMPYLLQKMDIMVQSRTGSGKTGAFLLPALETVDPAIHACQLLILVPTRELALQVWHEAKAIFANTGISTAAVYGGVSYSKQTDAIKAGAQIVVGTPGRILDHLTNRTLTLDSIRSMVFDEADRMLSIGFYQDMKDIQRYLPKKPVAVHFFSATFPGHVLRMAEEFMRTPCLLSLSQNQVHVAGMEHIAYTTKPMGKDRALIRILEMESPTAAIIFCNTKANVHYVTGLLQGFGYNAAELSADLSQARREEVLLKVRNCEVRFLVATDVAARGIDIPEVSHVILYEPPEDREAYIHRAGRTGRAGAGGTVISLVDIMQKMELARISKHYKIEIQEKNAPEDVDLEDIISERLVSMLEGQMRKHTRLEKERMTRLIPLAKNLATEEDSLILVAMLLDEVYQKSLHSAPALPMKKNAEKVTPARNKEHNKNGHGNRQQSRGPHGKVNKKSSEN